VTPAARRLLRPAVLLGLVAGLLLLGMSGALAQPGEGEITGSVVGPDGEGLADVAVTAFEKGGDWGWHDPVLTDAEGAFTLPVPAGTWVVHYEVTEHDPDTWVRLRWSEQWSGGSTTYDDALELQVVGGETTPAPPVGFSRVSGQITLPPGAVASSLRVEAQIAPWYPIASAEADADGSYDLLVAPAEVVLRYDYEGSHTGSSWYLGTGYQFAGGAVEHEAGTPLVVPAGQVVTGQDIAFAGITGAVAGPAGEEIWGYVEAYRDGAYGPVRVGDASVAEEGTYQLVVPPGDARVHFDLYSDDIDQWRYVRVWYPSAAEESDAAAVAAPAGGNAEGIAPTLAAVRGTVTVDGDRDAEVWVSAHADGGIDDHAGASAAADGSYDLWSHAGPIAVQAQASLPDFSAWAVQWYPAAFTREAATAVDAVPGTPRTGIDLHFRVLTGAAGGEDATWVEVAAFGTDEDVDDGASGYAYTDGDGAYALLTPDADVHLRFEAWGDASGEQWWPGALNRNDAQVPSATAGLDALFVLIGGMVRGPEDEPLPWAEIVLFPSTAGSDWDRAGGRTHTAWEGSWSVLAPPGDVRVLAFGAHYDSWAWDSYFAGWVGDTWDLDAATVVPLVGPAVDVGTLAFAAYDGQIATHDGWHWGEITAYAYPVGSEHPWAWSTPWYGEGSYTLLVPAGAYHTRFEHRNDFNDAFGYQWAPATLDRGAASALSLSPGQQKVGPDATFAYVSGHVRDAEAEPLSGAVVSLQTSAGGPVAGSATTDAYGSWATHVLPAVHRAAVAAGEVVQWWPDGASFAEGQDIDLRDAHRDDIDFTLTDVVGTAPTWPPGAALTTRDLTSSAVTVEWPPAEHPTGVTGYQVRVDGGFHLGTGPETSEVTISSLEPDTTYEIAVVALAGMRASTPLLTEVTTLDVEQPGDPVELIATAQAGGRVELSWAPATAAVTQLQVHRAVGAGDLVKVADLDPAATSYTDTGLEPSTAYRYLVRSVTAAGLRDHTVEATATTPAMTLTSFTWHAPTVKPKVAEPTRALSMTLRGERSRTATAEVTYTTWFDEGGAELGSPRAETVTVPLTEGSAGVYTGAFDLVEGVASVTGIVGRLASAGTALTSDAVGLPIDVGSVLRVSLGSDVGSIRLHAWSDTAQVGQQRSVTGMGPHLLTRLVAAPDHRVTLATATGAVVAEQTGVVTRPGLTTDVTLTPAGVTTLTATVLRGDQPLRGATVWVTAADGTWRGSATSRADGTAVVGPYVASGTVTVHASQTADATLSRLAPTQAIDAGQTTAQVVFVPPPTGTVTGLVTLDGVPLDGADIVIDQHFEGRVVTARTRSAADGTYTQSVLAGEVSVRVSHLGQPPFGPLQRTVPAGGQASADVNLVPPQGYAVTLDVYTQEPGAERIGPADLDWRSAVHLQVSLRTPTATMSVDSRRMLIAASPGQTLELCANGSNYGLGSDCDEVTLGDDKAVTLEVTLSTPARITGTAVDAVGAPWAGSWTAEVHPVVGDERQAALHAFGFGSEITIGVPGAGTYDLVFNGLESRTERVVVAAGVTSIGAVDLSEPSRAGGPATEVRALQPEVLPGGLAEYRVVLEAPSGGLPDAALRVVVPGGTTLPAGGATLDGRPVDVTPAPGGFLVDLPALAAGALATLRFAVAAPSTAPAGTVLRASALLVRGEMEDPLGSAVTRVGGLSIEAPELTGTREVVLSGRGPAGATVALFDGSRPIGSAEIPAGGFWRKAVTLVDRGTAASHPVRAEAPGPAGVLLVAQVNIEVDLNRPELIEVAVVQPEPSFASGDVAPANNPGGIREPLPGGRRVTFDPREGIARFPYVFVPGYPMVVEARFTAPERVTYVEAWIGDRTAIATRIGTSDRWRAEINSDGSGMIEVDFEYDAAPFTPTTDHPTEREAREQMPPLLDDFEPLRWEDEEIIVDLPSLDLEMAVQVEREEVEDGTFTPSAADLTLARETGVPLYGLEITEVDTDDEYTITMTGYMDTAVFEALEAGASVQSAWRLSAASGVQPASVRGAFTRVVKTVKAVAKPAARVFRPAAVLYNAVTAHRKYDRLGALHDNLGSCTPSQMQHYSDRIDGQLNANLVGDVSYAGMVAMGAGLGMVAGPPGAAVGFLAAGVFGGLVKGANYLGYRRLKRDIGANCKEGPPDRRRRPINPVGDPVWIMDPSGFVYEGPESNRIEGVTATVLQGFPDDAEPTTWEPWDAEWFGQANPMDTDADGRYGWDVPQGWWRVTYQMDGYELATSAVLRVLPIHLDVDVGLIPLDPPVVASATGTTAGGSALVLTFSQWMRAATVNPTTVTVLDGDGDPVPGSIEPVDPEDGPARDGGHALAEAFRFVPDEPFAAGDEVEVEVDGVVQNHAGRTMLDSVSATATVTAPATAPGVPQQVAATRGDGQATLTWAPPEDDGGSAVLDYRVWVGDAVEPLEVDGTETVVTGLTNGTTYSVTVAAANAVGVGAASEPVTVTPAGAPLAPPSVSAAAGVRSATVTWTEAPDNGAPVTSYLVTVSPNHGTVSGPLTGASRSATVTGLQNGTAYTFAVRAVNDVGQGATAQASATTPGLPGAPASASAVRGDRQATVSWTPPASNGGSPITGYTITVSPGGAVVGAGASATSRVVSGLTNGTAYTFAVRAVTAVGAGSARTTSAVTPAGLPTAPTGVTATAGDARATVSWNAAAPNGAAITGYTVTASPGGRTATVAGSARRATVTGLTNGTAYRFTVRAANAVGQGPASAQSAAVTPSAPPPPPVATPPLPPGFDGNPATTQRIGASRPADAAIELSRRRFVNHDAAAPAAPKATHVVLSRDDTFPDSLAGASLTKTAPMLFTATSQLHGGRWPRSSACCRAAAPSTCSGARLLCPPASSGTWPRPGSGRHAWPARRASRRRCAWPTRCGASTPARPPRCCSPVPTGWRAT
jgi:hypothetical protein